MQKDLQYRFLSVEKNAIDEEQRTVNLAFSSEQPYERANGFEILGHKSGEVNLDFLSSKSAPLLLDHDPKKQIGVIESVVIENGVGRAVARFGKNGLSADIFEDVVDGIRKNISVGYLVKEIENLERTDQGIDQYRVSNWFPKEISVVSIPADPSVGIGRSDTKNNNNNTKMDFNKMDKKTKNEVTETPVDVAAIRKEAQETEAKRIRSIMSVGNKFDMASKADEFIKEDKSADDFRAYVLDNVKSTEAPTASNADIGLTESEKSEYSVMKLVRTLSFPEEAKYRKEAAFELEASQAAADKSGVQARGMMIPSDILTRDLNVGTATAGGNFVGTEVQPQNFIELLRNKMVVKALGARVVSGLNGNVAFPRQSGANSAYWIAEGAAPTEGQQTIDQVTMTPRTVAAYTDYTRQLLLQSSMDVENFVMDDLSTVLALAMDHAALYGTGASGQPTGIANTAGINAPAAFAGAVPTFAEVVAMESAVAVDNALTGNLSYLTDPTTRGGLKTATKDAGSGQFVWDKNQVNGYNAEASNQVTAGDVFYGNWADLIIGMWGGLDITVDPYSLSTTGGKRIVAFQSTDIAVRHPVSFAFNNDTI